MISHSKLALPRIGLGCMGLSEFYGDRRPTDMLESLHRAVSLGYCHFDTADMYGSGENEQLLGRFLHETSEPRSSLQIASKVGIVRDPAAKYRLGVNGRPDYVQQACEASLLRLGLDSLDLYYLHRVDPEVPIAETVGAMATLAKRGLTRGIGLCEVDAATLRRAHAEQPITAVQSEYSLWSRDVEAEVLPTCRELGIGFVAFSPLGRGFLTGTVTPTVAVGFDAASDLRALLPRFQDENVHANYELVERFRAASAPLGVGLSQVALAWLLAQGPGISVIPGATSFAHLSENLAAGGLALPAALVARLSEIFASEAVHGARYPGRASGRSGGDAR